MSRPYPRRPRPPPHTRWPWYMRPPTLVGARVPRARPAPRSRSDCRTSRAGGGPPGTSAPTTGPSHVPAPATFPSQPRSSPSHVPAVVLAAESCAPSRNRAGNAPLRGLGPARRTSKALSAGAGNVFSLASLGVGREIGIRCPEKIWIRVKKRPLLNSYKK